MSSSEEQNSQYQQAKVKLPLLGLKVLELCFVVVCIGLIDDPANNSHIRTFITQRTIGLSYATFGAFLIFTGVYLLMKVFRDTCPWKTSALMSLIGFILFLACASMLFRDWANVKERNYWPPNAQRLDFICSTASIALIVSVLFLCDLLLTVRLGIKGEMD